MLFDLNVYRWHAEYERLQTMQALPQIDPSVAPDGRNVYPATLKGAIDDAFTQVVDTLRAYLPDGYRPPMDDRAQQLLAAITRYAYGSVQ